MNRGYACVFHNNPKIHMCVAILFSHVVNICNGDVCIVVAMSGVVCGMQYCRSADMWSALRGSAYRIAANNQLS